MHYVNQCNWCSFFLDLGINLWNNWFNSCLVDLILEHFLENSKDYFELLIRSFWKLHIDSIRNSIGPLPNCLYELNKLRQRLFSKFIYFIDLAVQHLITTKINSFFEQINFVIAWRCEIFHLYVEAVFLRRLTLSCQACLFIGKISNDVFKTWLNLKNRALLIKWIVPKILNKELRNYVEIFFIVMEDELN